MPQFHETGYGRAFFQAQLPQLINTLSAIGSELKRGNDLKEQKATATSTLSAFKLDVTPNLNALEFQSLTNANILIQEVNSEEDFLIVLSPIDETALKTYAFVSAVTKL